LGTFPELSAIQNGKGIKMKWELLLSSSLVGITLILLQIPPFQTAMDFGKFSENSWSNEQSEPLILYLELPTLSEYSAQAGKDITELLHSLKNLKHQPVDTFQTIERLAELNGLSPRDLITWLSIPKPEISQYMGYMRKKFSVVVMNWGFPKKLLYNGWLTRIY
jgi:hypothetical protein